MSYKLVPIDSSEVPEEVRAAVRNLPNSSKVRVIVRKRVIEGRVYTEVVI